MRETADGAQPLQRCFTAFLVVRGVSATVPKPVLPDTTGDAYATIHYYLQSFREFPSFTIQLASHEVRLHERLFTTCYAGSACTISHAFATIPDALPTIPDAFSTILYSGTPGTAPTSLCDTHPGLAVSDPSTTQTTQTPPLIPAFTPKNGPLPLGREAGDAPALDSPNAGGP